MIAKLPSTIRTERLVLRQWNLEDFEPFAKINSDPRVMEYFPFTLTREQSDALAEKIIKHTEENGWGLWAVGVPGKSDFIGFIGLLKVSFSAHFTPAVEIGWRLNFDYWGKGYATEGARAVLKYAFETLMLKEIVSFTAEKNIRSQRVMQKIGLHHNQKDDFDHPKLPDGHLLKRHVLYRVKSKEWRNQQGSKTMTPST